MLVPAILYKNEILTKIQEYNYSEDMMYYSGYLGNALPSIEADTINISVTPMLRSAEEAE